MIKAFGIFFRDLRKIIRRPVALILVIGLMILPSLYAWFNIDASWDPYGNTQNLKVAVANCDSGTELDGVEVNLGDQIIEKLHGNDQIGWQFVDEDVAMQGVKDGSYYAAVIIPEDFSTKIASIITDDIQQAEIVYYVNEKKNAIAPKITNTGVSSLQNTINQMFIKTATQVILSALQMTADDFKDLKVNPLNSIISQFEDIDNSLNDFSLMVSSLSDTTKAIDELVNTTNNLLPETESLLNDVPDSIQNLQSLLVASEQLAKDIRNTVADSLDMTSEEMTSIGNSLDSSFDMIGTDADAAADNLNSLSTRFEPILTANNNVQTLLNNMRSFLRTNERIIKIFMSTTKYNQLINNINTVDNKIETANTTIRGLQTDLKNAASTLRSTGSLPTETLNSIRADLRHAQSQIDSIRSDYSTNVSPQFYSATTTLYDNMSSLTSIVNETANIIPKLGDTLDGVSKVTGHTVDALEKSDTLINNTHEKLQELLDKLNKVSTDDQFTELVDTIRNDPELAAEFMASPVSLRTERIYPIENYGSAMTPFYSILAIWVGCLLLSSIMKVQVKEDIKYHDLTHVQTFFARFYLFAFITIIQALIICLGDLFIFHIQCLYPLRFLFVGIVCAIVFTTIVYTLAAAFGDLGKAIAVILLVIQVAGAGGTFPIELIPSFFNKLNPYMPFTFGINAMRECIGGLYGHTYWNNLLALSAIYIPIMLIIGLLMRRQVAHIKKFFASKIEETGVM